MSSMSCWSPVLIIFQVKRSLQLSIEIMCFEAFWVVCTCLRSHRYINPMIVLVKTIFRVRVCINPVVLGIKTFFRVLRLVSFTFIALPAGRIICHDCYLLLLVVLIIL